MLTPMDTTDIAAMRVRRFLETEPVIWLSTTRADGAPHLVPTWFVWDGAAIVIVSKPGAVKVRNLRADPRAMLALGDADADFDVGLLEARAEVLSEAAPLELPAGFGVKYAARIGALGLTPAQFARTYSQVIRLVPVKALAWHGRTTPRSVLSAARRVAATGGASLAEPRNALRQWLGEPLAQGLAGGPDLARRGVAI
jgi:PPOX class probable F420-dependent enzyme